MGPYAHYSHDIWQSDVLFILLWMPHLTHPLTWAKYLRHFVDLPWQREEDFCIDVASLDAWRHQNRLEDYDAGRDILFQGDCELFLRWL